MMNAEVPGSNGTNAALLHQKGTTSSERNANFKIFMENLKTISKNNEKCRQTAEKFYVLLSSFEFLPNSPTLMNAGRSLQQLSACYVLPVEDSIEGIFDSVKNMSIIHKSGGGTGFSFSRLRPRDSIVKSTKGKTSGPISFMQIFDRATEIMKHGGNRRGANMGIMRYDHPDILEFIDSKKGNTALENFNISVAIDSKFMNAVENDWGYDLINPKDGSVTGRLNARDVFEKMVQGAWETGDPGFVVIDRINNSNSNPTPHLGEIESTNPCVVGSTLVPTEIGLLSMKELSENHGLGGINIIVNAPIKSSDSNLQLLSKTCLKTSIFKAFKTGVKKTFKVITESGYEVEATSDHKMLTTNGWKEVKDITIEDKVILQSDDTWSGQDNLPFNPLDYGLAGNGFWTAELGEVLGWLVGDGWLRVGDKNARVGFTFGKYDVEVLSMLKPFLNEFYGKNIKEILRPRNTTHLSYHGKGFAKFFLDLGVKPRKAAEKEVPVSIFKANKSAVIGFLRGLFTADGTISTYEKNKTFYIRLTSKSGKLLKQVQILLLNLGLKSKIYERHRKRRLTFKYKTIRGELKLYETDGELYELQISKDMVPKFLDKVGFIGSRHSGKIKRLRNVHFYSTKFEDRVISIEPLGEQEVYDLIEPLTHSFIANGIVVHNCGEQPLMPYEPCNLGSINLSKFVDENAGDMDWIRLEKCVFDSVHFLDNVIDVNNYPIPEIEEMAKGNRRIGLGVMGLAETFVKLKIPYNSNEAAAQSEKIMKFINEKSLAASEEMAKERGAFFNFKNSIYDESGKNFRGVSARPRHSARTTIAPTGTIAITAGLQGAGIEPFFAIVYTRYNAKGIDALKSGETPSESDTFFEVNPLFRKIAEKNNFFDMKDVDLWKEIEKNHGSVVGIKEIPESIQNLFLTSHDIKPLEHVRIQAAFQKHVDNAVSKTVNLPNFATEKDIETVYKEAYRLGCKGVTVYRDGSKSFQVLNLDKKKKKKERAGEGFGASSHYYDIKTGHGPLHLHINYDEEGPVRVFSNISPAGTEISGLTLAMGILLSKYFELGGDPERILKHLNSIKGDRPLGFGTKRVDSIPHAIAIALRDHLVKTGKLDGFENKDQKTLGDVSGSASESIFCQKCFSPNVEVTAGCSGPTCFDCGHSECN